jgi:hypothetical protein
MASSVPATHRRYTGYLLPETGGKTLEGIEAHFAR